MQIKVGRKAIKKLQELVTEHVLPSILTPAGIRKRGIAHADAKAYEMRKIAQAENDVKEILEGNAVLGPDGQVVRKSQLSQQVAEKVEQYNIERKYELLHQANTAGTLRELKRHINLLKALELTEELAEETPDERVSNERIDTDWFARWRSGVEDVSNEDMRIFWARILAGETSQPDTYSLRALDLLRRLSRTDAELISKVAPFVFVDMVPRIDELFKEIQFSDFLELGEIGVCTNVNFSGLTRKYYSFSTEKFGLHLLCNEKILVISHTNPDKFLQLPGIPLTRAGREVISLGRFSANTTFMENVAKNEIKPKGFSVQIGDIEPVGSTIQNLVPI